MSIARELAELGGSYGSGGFVGMKNRIINGAMMIDQRNAGAAITLAAGAGAVSGFGVDRWNFFKGNAGAFTVQRSSVAPAGFVNSTLITVTTTMTPASTDYACCRQNIEGLNVADFGWGTANAQPITLSFWVRCSVTGTFNWSVLNSAETRGYVSSFTINSTNTWEYKTLTIAGDTSGTWLTDNGVGLRLLLDLGTGSTYCTTAGTWQTFNYAYGLTGGTKLMANSGATLYITGVQLEKGSTATSFDYRAYGQELALCQRYFEQIYGGGGAYTVVGLGSVTNSTAVKGPVSFFQVAKRATPTITVSGNYQILNGGSFSVISYTAPDISNNFCTADISGTGFTAGQSVALRNSNDTTAKITASAEL